MPGEIWHNTNDGKTYISGSAQVTANVIGNPGSIGTIYNSSSLFSAMEPIYSFKAGNRRLSMSESDISQILLEKEELEKLCSEQPSVQEAFARLQTLIKLYRE